MNLNKQFKHNLPYNIYNKMVKSHKKCIGASCELIASFGYNKVIVTKFL